MSLLRVFYLVSFLCLNTVIVSAQKNKSTDAYYAFDANWKPVSDFEKATYFSRVKKVNDTCWVINMYNVFGPMVSKEVYKDQENKIAHGTWIFYKKNGYPDSICSFQNNLAQGKWHYFNDTGAAYLEKEYVNGHLRAVRDLLKEDSMKKKDTIPATQDGRKVKSYKRQPIVFGLQN